MENENLTRIIIIKMTESRSGFRTVMLNSEGNFGPHHYPIGIDRPGVDNLQTPKPHPYLFLRSHWICIDLKNDAQ